MIFYADLSGACCLCRLTDDQSQPRIGREAEAIERIFTEVRLGAVELVSSEALEEEVRRIESPERRLETEALLSLAATVVEIEDRVLTRAHELKALGYGLFDALHLASAEVGGAHALLSTDDRLVSRARRGAGNPRIAVMNPLSWEKDRHTK